MNTTQMKCFVALYNSKSFTKAAESLFMSQPAISKNISALEEELEITLVERKKGGKIQITKAGEAFYASFDEILEKLDETNFRAKYILPDTNRVYHIGVMDTWYLPDLIRMCNEELPESIRNTEFIFEFVSPGTVNTLIENRTLDFVFTIGPAYQPNKNYVSEFITNIYSSLYTSSDNPDLVNGKIDLDTLTPILYMISKQQVSHTNQELINQLFYPRKPLVKEVLSGQSAFMNITSGMTGAAIADNWSLNQFSPETTSLVLKNMSVPVIFVKKITNNTEYNLAAEHLHKKIFQWVDKKGVTD